MRVQLVTRQSIKIDTYIPVAIFFETIDKK